jgi:hypothetical protein
MHGALLGACTSHIGTRLQAMLLELHKSAPGGCCNYASPETDRPLVCKAITMREGQVLYLPKGVIHSATASSEGSTHLTVAIRQYDLSWTDLFWAVLTDVHGLASSGTSSCAADRGHATVRFVRR